jgi:hypothetical protein
MKMRAVGNFLLQAGLVASPLLIAPRLGSSAIDNGFASTHVAVVLLPVAVVSAMCGLVTSVFLLVRRRALSRRSFVEAVRFGFSWLAIAGAWCSAAALFERFVSRPSIRCADEALGVMILPDFVSLPSVGCDGVRFLSTATLLTVFAYVVVRIRSWRLYPMGIEGMSPSATVFYMGSINVALFLVLPIVARLLL